MKPPFCRNCNHHHWPYESCPRDIVRAVIVAVLLALSAAAFAHPGKHCHEDPVRGCHKR